MFLLVCANASVHADTLYVSTDGASGLNNFNLSKFSSSGVRSPFVPEFAAFNIAFDGAGNLYAVSGIPTDTVVKYAANGTKSTIVDFTEWSTIFSSGLSDLTFDSAGNLYVSSHDKTEKFSATGTDLGVFANKGGDLAFDSAGNLFVSSSGKVEKYSATGTDLGVFANKGGGSLAFDSTGDLYVGTAGGIEKFSATGTDLGAFESGVLGDFAFDSSGDLFVTRFSGLPPSGGGGIEEYSPSGTDLGLFASTGGDHPYAVAFTKNASTSTPDAASTCVLLGMALAGLAGWRHTFRAKLQSSIL